MLLKWSLLFLCLFITVPSVTLDEFSKGKQQQHFPKKLKKKQLYLGMTLKKFHKKAPNATRIDTASEFKIEYTEAISDSSITSYSYLFTKDQEPLLYAITIAYKDMSTVRALAESLMGKPKNNEEWRMEPSMIKEDFTMGAWTFGHKLVYGATIINSEWEQGFQSN
ncbi:hypothetical protein DCS32_00615 [Dokdonia sp. Dokd-P16]|uniref:hypothetical protein n=1 Tax=Dokdonia sp. Dokd-P16 TaxID=2173169 RepID=UPI000D5453F0|nr:hypothetical protein [Dokdonia sp. Dokd-P16]AWH72725.1 hypothetical protein DCS32_00615 [Dokdonia sp. Dokd-P16]